MTIFNSLFVCYQIQKGIACNPLQEVDHCDNDVHKSVQTEMSHLRNLIRQCKGALNEDQALTVRGHARKVAETVIKVS